MGFSYKSGNWENRDYPGQGIKVMMKEESPLRAYEIPRNHGHNICGSEYMG